MIRTILMVIVCSILLACKSSPPKHYFILSATATTSQPSASTSSRDNAGQPSEKIIGIGPIEIADYLDKSYIGYTENNNTITIVDNHYWAEPLEKGIARVTLLNLSQLNSDYSFIGFPWRSDNKPQYSLRIQLHSLTRSDNQASINATWELIDNQSKDNLKRKNFSQSIPVESGTRALVQGYSNLLANLAIEMNHSLANLR